MNYSQTKELLKKYDQEQLLKYYDELDDNSRELLLKQIEDIDFDLLKLLDNGSRENTKGKITPLDDAVSIDDIEKNRLT